MSLSNNVIPFINREEFDKKYGKSKEDDELVRLVDQIHATLPGLSREQVAYMVGSMMLESNINLERN